MQQYKTLKRALKDKAPFNANEIYNI